MKKQTFNFSFFRPFALLPLFLLTLYLVPCTLVAQQMTDSSFETWENKNGFYGDYFDFITDYFCTLNELHSLQNDAGSGDLTAFRDGNAQNGNWCAKLVTGKYPLGSDILLPGIVGTLQQDFIEYYLTHNTVIVTSDWQGYPVPRALEGYFKYAPVNGDSAVIELGLYEYGDSLHLEQLKIFGNTDVWTPFSVNIPQQFWNSNMNEIRLLFVASADYDFGNLIDCQGQYGSTLWVDNITLRYDIGISQNMMSTLKVNTFPNPTTDVVNMNFNEDFNGKIEVFALHGAKVYENVVNGNSVSFSASNLPSGNYMFRLMKENVIHAQGKFVVNK